MDLKPHKPRPSPTECTFVANVTVPDPKVLNGFRCKPSSRVICRPCAERFDQRKKII